MRSIWKGTISFGLVSIPIRVYPATQPKDLSFRLLHRACNTPIQYRKVCPHCGTEVSEDEVVRGYEYERGRFVILTEEDFDSVPADGARAVEILDFVALAEIDPIFFARSYYLEPAEGGEKPYALLHRAMQETARVGIARVRLRSKESLAAVRVYGKALLLATMFYAGEIRPVEALGGLAAAAPTLSPREVSMAKQLVDNLSVPFDPGRYPNRRDEALYRRIEEKIRGRRELAAPPPAAPPVTDLLEALKASLAATGNRRPDGRPAAAPAAGDDGRLPSKPAAPEGKQPEAEAGGAGGAAPPARKPARSARARRPGAPSRSR